MITHLGDIQLGGTTRAVHGLSKRVGYQFATHEKPLGKASKQKLGGKLDEWRLNFELNFHFCEPQVVLEQMERVCASGDAVPLVFDYVSYKGWVTLDDINITYQHTAPNGQPLVIRGTLTMSEFTGDTNQSTPAPAVRDTSTRVAVPVPVQTAVTTDTRELLPFTQPMQHLEAALIAQHRARALVRDINNLSNADVSSLKSALDTINRYFASGDAFDFTGIKTAHFLPAYDANNMQVLVDAMNEKAAFFVELGRKIATRVFR